MDQLLPDQQESLRKTNTEHLRVMAAKTGEVDEDELMTLDRSALLQIVAHDILDRKEVEKGATYRWKSERSDPVREMTPHTVT